MQLLKPRLKHKLGPSSMQTKLHCSSNYQLQNLNNTTLLKEGLSKSSIVFKEDRKLEILQLLTITMVDKLEASTGQKVTTQMTLVLKGKYIHLLG